jgi:GDP-D-mannose dehydratase
MSKKTALITEVTGQDGAYLADLLLNQGIVGPRHQTLDFAD